MLTMHDAVDLRQDVINDFILLQVLQEPLAQVALSDPFDPYLIKTNITLEIGGCLVKSQSKYLTADMDHLIIDQR